MDKTSTLKKEANHFFRHTKKIEGITLIALVVTIIVLIILAGVSINLILGQNGIVTKAKVAKLEHRAGTVEDEVSLWKMEKQMGQYSEEPIKSRDELIDDQLSRGLLTPTEADTARTTGKVEIGSKTIDYTYEEEEIDEHADEKIIQIFGDGIGLTKSRKIVTLNQLDTNWNENDITDPWTEMVIGEQITTISRIKKTYENELSYYFIDDKNDVYSYGKNDYGQLGIGNTTNQDKPVKIEGLSNITDIYMNGYSVYAKNTAGEIYAWGRNDLGQLGIDSKEDTYTPTKISILEPVSKLFVGTSVVALTEGKELYSWGENNFGQLGIGNEEEQTKPQKVEGLSHLIEVLGYGTSYYALDESGQVYAWGSGGMLGLRDTNDDIINSPRPVSGLSNVANLNGIKNGGYLNGKNGEIYYIVKPANHSNSETDWVTGSFAVELKLPGAIREVYNLWGNFVFRTMDEHFYIWIVSNLGKKGLEQEQYEEYWKENAIVPDWEIGNIGEFKNVYYVSPGLIFNYPNGEIGIWAPESWAYEKWGVEKDGSNVVKLDIACDIENIYERYSHGEYSTYIKSKDGLLYVLGHNEEGDLGIGHMEFLNAPVCINNLENLEFHEKKIDKIYNFETQSKCYRYIVTSDGKCYKGFIDEPTYGAACVFGDSNILISQTGETIEAKNMIEGSDVVYYNVETGKTEIGTIAKKYIHKDATNFVTYTFKDGSSVKVTDYHPIYTKDGWKSLTRKNGYEKPKIGDSVKTEEGWKELTNIEAWNGLEDCYDFEIRTKDGKLVDNYFANGTLVHSSY